MSSFSNIKLKSFVFSLILALVISIITYFSINFRTTYQIENISQFLILTTVLTLVSFFFTYLYLKFFVENKIKEIYNSIIPKKDIIEENLISTNMEDLVNQLKNYSIESQTEIKSMKEKENFRRNFIGNLAHELKTPLFTSQSYLLTLIDGALKDEKVNLKYLKIAEKAIERLIFIAKDLDLITKLESENMKLEKTSFNLISVINNVFEMLEIQAEKNNISLIIDSKKKKINVTADQEKIHQVLTNLIENSVKYGISQECNEIIINMKDQGSKVRFEIEDRGQGIPADQRERVFERFFRIQNNNTSLKEGTGLGLSIVKNLVNLMGGSVGNEKAYPEGTIFWFTLNKKN